MAAGRSTIGLMMTEPTNSRHVTKSGEEIFRLVEMSGDEVLTLGVALKQLGTEQIRAEPGHYNDDGDLVIDY